MKFTITEFAREIRKMYPNDYNDLTDKKLVELWLKKYPKDIEKVNIGNGQSFIDPEVSEILPKDASGNSNFGDIIIAIFGSVFNGILLFALAIIFGVPISYYFQPEKVREIYTLPQYIKAIPDLANSEKADFQSAIIFSVIICFVIICIFSYLLKRGSKS